MNDGKEVPLPRRSPLRESPIPHLQAPYPRILDSRRENEEASKVFSKTQSLRIENSELSALSSINSRFSRGEENKKPPRHSQITQPLRIENSEPLHPLVTNSRFSRGEGREAKSVQDAPEENIFRTNVRALAPPSFTRLKIQQEDKKHFFTRKLTFAYTKDRIHSILYPNGFIQLSQIPALKTIGKTLSISYTLECSNRRQVKRIRMKPRI